MCRFVVHYLTILLLTVKRCTTVEKQRFWEEYEHYIKNGGNTYIKEWTEKLKKEEKI